MEHHQIDGFLGTFYSQTHDQQLAATPDFVEYFVPPVEYTAWRYSTGSPYTPVESSLFASYATSGPNTYSVFLHGDFPLLHVQTSNNTGRKIMIIKESFGNAFAPFLVSHYDDVYIVDQRYFELGVEDFVRENGITDLLFLNNIFAVNTGVRINELQGIRIKATPHRQRYSSRRSSLQSSRKRKNSNSRRSSLRSKLPMSRRNRRRKPRQTSRKNRNGGSKSRGGGWGG